LYYITSKIEKKDLQRKENLCTCKGICTQSCTSTLDTHLLHVISEAR
jgi:hypothetical protein